MSKNSLIDSIDVQTPCSEDWDKMRGNDKMRFCGHCVTEVNNISEMTRKQAMRLVRASGGRICVRYVKNPVTGKPVFAGKLYQITRRAGLAAGVLGASLSLSTMTYAQQQVIEDLPAGVKFSELLRIESSTKIKTDGSAASISGIVTDKNGAVIPYAGLTLTNEETNELSIMQTDDSGAYEFADVPAGKYTLNVNGGEDFAEKDITNIEVAAGNEIIRNVSLDLSDRKSEAAELEADARTLPVMMGMMVSVIYKNPLVAAVSDDNLAEVKNLIARGEKVNGKDENYDRITPLFIAVENGNVEIAETLLNFGAKINARDRKNQTPLMRLDEDASAELVRLLIKHGAEINLTDADGNTALIFAASSVKTEVLQILIDHGADVNAQNKEGQTALMNAAEADNVESVRALLAAGAKVNLKNKAGETAWDLTASEEIETLLESHGAIVEDN